MVKICGAPLGYRLSTMTSCATCAVSVVAEGPRDGTDGDATLAPDACAGGLWESVRKYSIRSVRQARRQGSRMSARTTPPRLWVEMLPRRAGRHLHDHLRHATEKRRRLEQTGIRQLNRQSECRSDEPAASKLLELDQDFTAQLQALVQAQWTREP